MSRIYGVVPGLVTEVNDNGTVKVKFPWLPEEPETDWIRIATALAGKDRGSFLMPEKEDEVLVAFQQGDTNFPYIVGYLWNGKDTPPCDNKNIRRIKTKSGHIIEFDDNENEERIHIQSKGNHTITLHDKDKKITVKSTGGHEITLNDMESRITIKSTIGQEIVIDDKAMKMTVKAPMEIDFQTLLAKFSGIVEAKMVRSEVVQSKIYTPGIGNIH